MMRRLSERENLMTDTEKLIYLSNLVIVARCDGETATSEVEVVTRACAEIGASNWTLQQALNQFGDPLPSLRALVRFSDRVRNLEDMIAICIADSELSPQEKKVIAKVAIDIGLSQDQTNQIISQVLAQR